MNALDIFRIFEEGMTVDENGDLNKEVTLADVVTLGEISSDCLEEWHRELDYICNRLREMLTSPIYVNYEHDAEDADVHNPTGAFIHICTSEYCGHGRTIAEAMGDAMSKLLNPNIAYYYKAVQARFRRRYDKYLEDGTITKEA